MTNVRSLSSKRNTSSLAPGVQAGITCTPQVVTGVDKLKVSCWFDWRNRQLFERLETHKRGLQDTKDGIQTPIDFTKSETRYNFNLNRTGTTKFSYRLSSGDITLLISPRPGESVLHNCQIEIGSLSCQEDAQGIYNEILAMFRQLDCHLIKEFVQEIHLAADLLGVHIQETDFNLENNWISRADNFNYYSYRRKMTGISIGSGNVMFRAYDKIKEMKIKRETSKQDFFAKKWKVEIEDIEVTRCEFQVRRPVLKEFDVPTDKVKDIFANLQAIWSYLSQDWCRFCTTPIDRENKNQKNAQTSFHWELVQLSVFSFCKRIARRIRQSLIKNTEALRDQYRGIAMSLVAAEGVIGDSLEHAIKTAQKIIACELRGLFERDESKYLRTMQIRFNESYVTVL